MQHNKEVEVRQQLILQCQNNLEAFDMVQQRRSGHYKPNIWKYDFLESLSSKYDEEVYKGQAEKLKEDVKQIFVEAVDFLAKLELVDNIRKLGLASHFEKEINEALDVIASAIKCKMLNVEENLYCTALCFRLLRQHGYEVSQDIFCAFVDERGSFIKSKCKDIKGLIELFEASHVGLEGENILDEAKGFSTTVLKATCSSLETDLAKHVAHSLDLPSHWRVLWFDVKWQISAYEKENKQMVQTLLDLAKINFNMVQAALQKDLKNISRWWRKLGLIENLDFTRDRLVESFLCSVGIVFEPQYSSLRKWLTKVVIMILIIDDVYDVYGSLDELQQFTHAVNRWDTREVQDLPLCMKLCFQALYDITNEIADEMQREKGWNKVQPHLKQVWEDFCKALFVEAEWYNKGHTPSLEEYLSNAWISSGGSLLSVHLFFSSMNVVTEEMINFLGKHQDLVHNISLIIRLCNDLGTSAAEQERGDAASSIVCYTREVNTSEDLARNHINGMINKIWRKINGQCYGQCRTQSPMLQSFVNINTNMARVVHNLYQYGDGFGVQDRDENKKQVMSLIIQPFKLD